MSVERIHWLGLIWRRSLWIALIPLLMGLLFTYVSGSARDEARALDVHGVNAVATITDKEVRERRDSDGTRQRSYYLQVRFEPSTGPAQQAWHQVSRSFYDDHTYRDEIPVRYVLHDPGTFELETGRTGRTGVIFGVVGAVLMLVGGGIAAWLLSDVPALWRVARSGQWRDATVTAMHKTKITVNNAALQRIDWQDSTGAVGQSRAHRAHLLPSVGEPIRVLVDPVTGRAWWQGDL